MAENTGQAPIRPDYESVNDEFVAILHSLSVLIHINARSHGWWDNPRNDGECIALIHSELSEWLECLRKEKADVSEHIPRFLQEEEEAADVIIRVLDFCYARGYRIGQAILAKHEYNKTRDYKHGGKRF